MGRKRHALMIVFAGNAQKAAGNVMVFNGFLLPLAVRAENHFMAVVMMGEYGMHQHHDTGESDGGTCDLTVHHRVALIFTAQCQCRRKDNGFIRAIGLQKRLKRLPKDFPANFPTAFETFFLSYV